ncbi:MAG: protein NO VEIN domain-containing protein [Candidatus Dormibacteria bacterium]
MPQEFLVLSPQQARQELFERALSADAPDWLRDADVLIREPAELPGDVSHLASLLGLSERGAWVCAQQLCADDRREEHARLGLAGERALVRVLEAEWPGSTNQVSLQSARFGYDVAFTNDGREWHLEVKATGRRGRLTIHITRNEFDVGSEDPLWRLVVLGLGMDDELLAVATAEVEVLAERVPQDVFTGSRWEAAECPLFAQDLLPGLAAFSGSRVARLNPLLRMGSGSRLPLFAWMPSANPAP